MNLKGVEMFAGGPISSWRQFLRDNFWPESKEAPKKKVSNIARECPDVNEKLFSLDSRRRKLQPRDESRN